MIVFGYFLDIDIIFSGWLKFKWIFGCIVQCLDYFDLVKYSFKVIILEFDDFWMNVSEYLEDMGISVCLEEMDNYFVMFEDLLLFEIYLIFVFEMFFVVLFVVQ